jgi:uncharacterized protein
LPLHLRPRDTGFYDLFTRQADQLAQGTILLAEAFTAHDRAEVGVRMRAAEHAADENTHNIIRRVNTTFVTPFDREDIYALASALDDVMDFMEEAVDLVVLYELNDFPHGLREQVDVLDQCARVTAEAMPRLQSMENIEEYWIEVNRLENEADRIYRQILATLFGGSYDALQVLKLKDVVDSLEAAADAFEKVANIVEQVAVKES